MEASAFARCKQFLNYHPFAKWLSIVSSIGAAILYVGLLILLAFFVDLIVNDGEVPSYYQLPVQERQLFLSEMIAEDKEEHEARVQQIKDSLKQLELEEDGPIKEWERREPPEKWNVREPAYLWWAWLHHFLQVHVNADAANRMRDQLKATRKNRGLEVSLHQPLGDLGLLSLVVRNRNRHDLSRFFLGHLETWGLGLIAGWSEWTWSNTAFLVGLFILAIVTAGLRLLLKYLSNYMAALAVVEAVTRLRRSIYLHTNRLGMLAFRALGPSEAVSVSTRDLEGVHDGLYQWLTVYFREPVKFALLLAFILMINVLLGMAFLLFAVLVWLIGGQIAVYFRQKGRIAEMHSADQLVLIQESLMLMRLVKVYLMESFNQTRVENQLQGYAKAQLERYRGEAIYRPLFFFLGLVAVLVLLFVAGLLILRSDLAVTSALVLTAAIISLYWPTLSFLEARRSVRRSKDSAKVLFSFLDRQGGVGQAIEATLIAPMTKFLQFDKVSLREPGSGRKLLQNVSFNIRAGQHVAIVGPDEMEKHALVYLLPRFLDPSSGEIRIDGKNLRWVTLDSLRTQIAMVLQSNLVFNDTIVNNIGCGDPAYNLQRIIDAAKMAHAHQFIQKLPQGYETSIGETGHPLKLGEKFRIALARALLREPAILVIEEPHVPLDDDTKGMIDDTYQRALAGRTVIFLPHRQATIRDCDQVFFLYLGQIEGAGEHKELLANSDLYRHLQYLEFNEFAGLLNMPEPRHEEHPL
jgi:ATP-binding cassette subfamily B protein